jgi:hypothetical protein
MNAPILVRDLMRESVQRSYITRLDFLDQSANLVKARLYILLETFVQVYRNDRYHTTNLVLIHNGQRVYARDELNGVWHRHPADDPERHDASPEGQRPATLSSFLDEVEMILVEMNLP